MRVAIVGGSLAGLMTGLALQRAGHTVVVLERDPDPAPPDRESAAADWRHRVPQSRQVHGFLGRTKAELTARAPDVWQALLDAGACEVDLVANRPAALGEWTGADGDELLRFVGCRRTTFEWVLRRIVESEVELRLGVVVSDLLVDDGCVVGVMADGEHVVADLVVDASGRAGGFGSRLARAGLSVAEPVESECGIVYTSRFYRLYGDEALGPLNRAWAAGGIGPSYSSMLFPADDGHFAVVLGRLPEDEELRPLQTEAGFDALAAMTPFLQEWVGPHRSLPVGPPVPMAGMRNMLRSPVPAPGLVAIGDAACTSDPAFGRGVSIAIASAWALCDSLHPGARDAASVATGLAAYAHWFDRTVRPWFDDAVQTDAWRSGFWRSALREGPDEPPPEVAESDIDAGTILAVAASVGGSALLWRSYVRHCMLLASPEAMFSDETRAATRQALDAGWVVPASRMPSRADVLDALAAVAG